MNLLILSLILLLPIVSYAEEKSVEEYDVQIETLKAQHKALLDDWNANDPDVKMLNRLREKTNQQRAIADQINVLNQEKKQLEASINSENN